MSHKGGEIEAIKVRSGTGSKLCDTHNANLEAPFEYKCRLMLVLVHPSPWEHGVLGRLTWRKSTRTLAAYEFMSHKGGKIEAIKVHIGAGSKLCDTHHAILEALWSTSAVCVSVARGDGANDHVGPRSSISVRAWDPSMPYMKSIRGDYSGQGICTVCCPSFLIHAAKKSYFWGNLDWVVNSSLYSSDGGQLVQI